MRRIKAQRRKRGMSPAPQGWGEAELEARAEKARVAIRKYDLMPPEYRRLVHDYGFSAVRRRMCEGATPEQIMRELTVSTS